MKKIIALLTLFVMTFTSGYATTGETTNLTSDDVLYANIFYIDGVGYIKENNKLKEIKGIEFYSIGGQRFIKKEGEIIKVTENKVFKINDTSYVKSNGKLITLDKYLSANPITTKQDTKSTTQNKTPKISAKKLALIKKQTINKIVNLVSSILDSGSTGEEEWNQRIIKDLRKDFTLNNKEKTNFLKDLVNESKDDKTYIEIGKNLKILENIEKIKVENIKSEEDIIEEEFSFEKLLKEIDGDIVNTNSVNNTTNNTIQEETNTGTTESSSNTESNNTMSGDDTDLEDLFGDLFKNL